MIRIYLFRRNVLGLHWLTLKLQTGMKTLPKWPASLDRKRLKTEQVTWVKVMNPGLQPYATKSLSQNKHEWYAETGLWARKSDRQEVCFKMSQQGDTSLLMMMHKPEKFLSFRKDGILTASVYKCPSQSLLWVKIQPPYMEEWPIGKQTGFARGQRISRPVCKVWSHKCHRYRHYQVIVCLALRDQKTTRTHSF